MEIKTELTLNELKSRTLFSCKSDNKHLLHPYLYDISMRGMS